MPIKGDSAAMVSEYVGIKRKHKSSSGDDSIKTKRKRIDAVENILVALENIVTKLEKQVNKSCNEDSETECDTDTDTDTDTDEYTDDDTDTDTDADESATEEYVSQCNFNACECKCEYCGGQHHNFKDKSGELQDFCEDCIDGATGNCCWCTFHDDICKS